MKKSITLVSLFSVIGFLLIYLSCASKKVALFCGCFFLLLDSTVVLSKLNYFNIRNLKDLFVLVWMIILLTFNFSTNSFNPKNIMYDSFQSDSESLVQDMIDAKNDGVDTRNYSLGYYGLGRYDRVNKATSFYISQYGLQGKFFQTIYKIPGKHSICVLLTALVLSLICYLISKKYNRLLAFCFFVTFLLSPWIVNFARNLYWVEFTWFIPMLIGLICSMNIRNKKISIACYFGAFVSVLIKSLCGYEYLSVILMGMIAFLTADLFDAICIKDNDKAKTLVKHIFFMGFFAVAGFAIALLIHAYMKGNRNIIEGLKLIYINDVLRRTLGGKAENFHPVYKKSLEASVITVIRMYYNFYTEIIAGFSGKFFIPLSILPILIFINSSIKDKVNLQKVILYFVFYVTCISWFVLGKSHSYIHTHMNYVLWYFGFVQVCFYIVADECLCLLKMLYQKFFAKEI
ncbi:MAG: hypothetical protein MJ196_02050 [Treponemataceae bacterium]|nr:hypothetical protein [Treponemataceae bacterium]